MRERDVWTLLVAAGLVAGCATRPGPTQAQATAEATRRPPNIPTLVRPTRLPSLTPSRIPTIAEPTAESTPDTRDQAIRQAIDNAQEDERLHLAGALIKHFITLPRPGSDANYGLLYTQRADGSLEWSAILDNPNCIMESLEAAGQLAPQVDIPGPISSGVRIQNTRADFDVEVLLAPAAGMPPVLTVVGYDGQTCPKDSMFDNFGDRAKQFARAAAKQATLLLKEVVEGIQEGVK